MKTNRILKSNPLCLVCGKETSRSDRKYCSKSCSAKNKSVHACKISKEDVIKYYIEQRLESVDIAQKFNMSVCTFYKYLKKYDIEKRGSYTDFKNKKIGKLLCLKPLFPDKNKNGLHVYWECVCDCGNIHTVISSSLVSCKFLACKECSNINRRSKEEIKNFVWNYISNPRIHKKRNLEFNISKEYAYELFLSQGRKCAITNLDIRFAESSSKHSHGYTTASLDRIDSSKGYIEGNVQWVHKVINIMKGSLNQDEFLVWCELASSNCGYNKGLKESVIAISSDPNHRYSVFDASIRKKTQEDNKK